MTNEKYWIGMVKKEDMYYVLAADKGQTIRDFGSKQKGLDFFTNAYDKSNKEGNIVAAIISNGLTQPKITSITHSSLEKKLFDFEKGVQPVHFGSELGFLYGFTCNGDKNFIQKTYEAGTRPKLAK